MGAGKMRGTALSPACCESLAPSAQVSGIVPGEFSLKAPVADAAILVGDAWSLWGTGLELKFEDICSSTRSSGYLSVKHTFANAPPLV